MSSRRRLLIKSLAQVVQVVNQGQRTLTGKATKNIAIQDQDGPFSIVVDSEGRIEAIGTDRDVLPRYEERNFDLVINGEGKSVVPGLIDAHTHPVWAGDRVHEFAMKLAGASYLEVHAAGGGIFFTVEKTRSATEEELLESLKRRLLMMLERGTTYVECKSGYGLDTGTELKMLRVITKAKEQMEIGISSTFCGAHAVPRNSTSEEATEEILSQQLPAVLRAKEQGDVVVDNIDVFCEKGVYDSDQSRRILVAGKQKGLQINFHGDELNYTASAEVIMGASIGATAISHLEHISDEGIEAMRQAGTVAVLLPTTAYILRLQPPPAARLVERGVAVALGSDFNPNAFCLSMAMVMHLGCVLLKLSMPEALAAATINSAASLGIAETHGSLEVGKMADLLLLNSPRWEHLIYQFGCERDIIEAVVKAGKVVVSRERRSPSSASA
ncbi:unnamed protein product [Cyprideis torosa]|uniref:Probable imidazolonepropionase n=1 Tax=Cyprideis torosa TaxID=163714 RepID=A0A7R8WCE0_9CRUS|nr:unnamed protein product [Cyprideis torosa]CAG0888330.1 unnamed protein product [Cyprideis torosa]